MSTTPHGSSGEDNLTDFDAAPIVWALDAFPDDLSRQQQLHAHAAEMIAALFPRSPVFPVYVLSEESFAAQGFSDFLKPALKPMARKSMSRILSEVSLANLRAPRVLVEPSASIANCAVKLSRFAHKIGAQLIAVSSHGRRGLARLFLGSFSETMLNKTNIPVLVAGPEILPFHARPSHVVFPTDFDPASRGAFLSILRLALWLRADLHLIHKSETEMFAGGWIADGAMIGKLDSPVDAREAESWMDLASSAGVTAQMIFDNLREPASEAIVEYVRQFGETPALLAINPRLGPLAETIFGSLTRDVIRASPSPVYVAPRAF